MANSHPDRTARAFFGRRRGKRLRSSQEAAIQELLPRLFLDPGTPTPKDLKVFFPRPVEEIRLEIGFGGGEHLLSEIARNPSIGFIGVEPFVNGMAKLLSGLEGKVPANLRLYNDDVIHILDWLPDSSLFQIDLLYPDPWPKKRHWKRRFVSQENLDRFARVLKSGGRFRFASDIESYVNWTLQHCRRHGAFEWEARHADDWRLPFENWPGTRYEAKALREGRKPAYLTFVRA